MSEESRIDRVKRFSKIWWQSRADAKKSQEYMALSLGVSKKTIQNWEKGTSSPDLFQGCEWFRVLGLNPMPYYLAFLYPDTFGTPQAFDNEDAVEKALILLIRQSSAEEKKELLFLMSGHHGSSWHSLLQMFTAHCHTSMRSRVTASRVILENYEMEEKTGTLVCPQDSPPDPNTLRSASSQGQNAGQNGEGGDLDPTA